jgi:hypothetical protein
VGEASGLVPGSCAVVANATASSNTASDAMRAMRDLAEEMERIEEERMVCPLLR